MVCYCPLVAISLATIDCFHALIVGASSARSVPGPKDSMNGPSSPTNMRTCVCFLVFPSLSNTVTSFTCTLFIVNVPLSISPSPVHRLPLQCHLPQRLVATANTRRNGSTLAQGHYTCNRVLYKSHQGKQVERDHMAPRHRHHHHRR